MQVWQTGFIGKLALKNRFMRSATYEGLGTDDGLCREDVAPFYRRLSEGQVGGIISSHLFVDLSGRASVGQLGIHADDCMLGLSQMVKAAQYQGTKIFAQLAHAGAHAVRLPGQDLPKGPSDIWIEDQPLCTAASLADLAAWVDQFTQAARRAKAAGFDGIQIHAAHGYLLSQFLSPHYNQRTDEWGGSVEHRAKLLIKIVDSIRQAVGQDYPLMVKMNGQDHLPDGLTLEEGSNIAVLLEAHGVDAIEISGGCGISERRLTPVRPVNVAEEDLETVYHIEAARRFKPLLTIPVILVGGINALSVANRLMADHLADWIALCRPLICEPRLIERWQTGDHRSSLCVRCSKCFKTLDSPQGLHCAVQGRLVA